MEDLKNKIRDALDLPLWLEPDVLVWAAHQEEMAKYEDYHGEAMAFLKEITPKGCHWLGLKRLTDDPLRQISYYGFYRNEAGFKKMRDWRKQYHPHHALFVDEKEVRKSANSIRSEFENIRAAFDKIKTDPPKKTEYEKMRDAFFKEEEKPSSKFNRLAEQYGFEVRAETGGAIGETIIALLQEASDKIVRLQREIDDLKAKKHTPVTVSFAIPYKELDDDASGVIDFHTQKAIDQLNQAGFRPPERIDLFYENCGEYCVFRWVANSTVPSDWLVDYYHYLAIEAFNKLWVPVELKTGGYSTRIFIQDPNWMAWVQQDAGKSHEDPLIYDSGENGLLTLVDQKTDNTFQSEGDEFLGGEYDVKIFGNRTKPLRLPEPSVSESEFQGKGDTLYRGPFRKWNPAVAEVGGAVIGGDRPSLEDYGRYSGLLTLPSSKERKDEGTSTIKGFTHDPKGDIHTRIISDDAWNKLIS